MVWNVLSNLFVKEKLKADTGKFSVQQARVLDLITKWLRMEGVIIGANLMRKINHFFDEQSLPKPDLVSALCFPLSDFPSLPRPCKPISNFTALHQPTYPFTSSDRAFRSPTYSLNSTRWKLRNRWRSFLEGITSESSQCMCPVNFVSLPMFQKLGVSLVEQGRNNTFGGAHYLVYQPH